MTAIVNKAYIKTITETQVSNLRPVNGERFMNALEATYGPDKVQKAMQWIMRSDEKSFSGMKEFKDRVVVAISGGALNPEDQVYLANAVFMSANDQTKAVKLNTPVKY